MSDTNQTSDTTVNGAGVVVPSLEQRAADAFGALEPVGEEGATSTPTDAASPADSSAPTTDADPIAKARAERRAKLAELNARQRNTVDARHAQREAQELRRQLEEANARAASLVDPTKLDPLKLVELGQRAGHSPAQIAEAIRNAMGSPELAAAHAAKQAVDPVVAKLSNDLQAALARIDAFERHQATSQQEAQERALVQEFAGFTAQNAATSPLAARFLESQGVDEFKKLVMGAADALPQNAGPQALLDEIEDRLTEFGKLYANTPQRTQANPPRTTHAAAQAPTHVTNTLAQQRSGVVDEGENWARMSLDERAARLFSD